MSITDELREYALGWDERNRVRRNLIDIADRIDSEYESKKAEVVSSWDYWESTHIKLPVDADGVPICVGDELDYLEALHPDVPSRFKVQNMFYCGNGKWHLRAFPATYDPRKCRHHYEPTVEDVMIEFATDWECAEDGEDKTAVLKEYAAKLHLVKEDE